MSLPGSLLAELRALAAREDRTLSREAARAIEAHVERYRRLKSGGQVLP
jgi:hypothetical protein